MPGRDISFGHGEQAGEPRLRCEQIVAAGVEPVIGDRIADRQELPLGVDEEREVHRERHGARRLGESFQPAVQDVWRLGVPPITHVFGHGLPQRLDPEHQIRGAVVVDRGDEVVGHSAGLFGEPLQGRRHGLDRLSPRQLDIDFVENSDELASALAARGGQDAGGVTHQAEMVDHAAPRIGHEKGVGPLLAGVGEHEQVAGEVAAVDGRDIGRIEHLPVEGAVPVEEVPLEARERLHGRDRRFQPLDGLGRAGPAEVAGRDRGEQIESHVGGRRPVRDNRLRVFLEIVGRQHVVRRRHERLEEAPGSPRDEAQILPVLIGDREPPRDGLRAAGPHGECRRRQPQQGERQRKRPGRRHRGDSARGDGEPESRAARHVPIEAVEPQPRPAGRLRRRRPFEQVAARRDQPHQCSRDRIARPPGLIGRQGNRHQGLHGREAQVRHQRAHMVAKANAAAAWQHREDSRKEGRHRNGGEHQHGSDRGRTQRQQPARAEARQRERRKHRPAQIVQHFPAADRRNGA